MTTLKKYISLMSRRTVIGCISVLILAAVGANLTARWPVMLGNLCNNITNGKTSDSMLFIFAGVCLGAVFVNIFRRVLLDCVIAVHEAEIREESLERLLKMPASYIADCPSGEKTAQLNQGVAGFSQLIKILCGDASGVLLTASFTLWEVYANSSGLMAAVILAYLVIAVVVSYLQIRSQKGIRESILSKKNALDGKICQSINNLKLIRGLNAEVYERKRLRPDIREISTTEAKHHCYMGSFDCVKQSVAYIFLIIILASYAREILPAASAATVCLLFIQMLKPIDEIYRFMDEGSASVIKARALLEIFSCEIDPVFSIRKSENADNIIGNEPSITLENVNINGLYYENINIPCSGRTALIGESGCGKSTIALGVIRFFGHSGNINVFGENLEAVTQGELSKLIHYVPPDKRFFAGTVRENLIYGIDRNVSDDEAADALSKACLWENGILDRKLGEGGTGLSTGQQRRLALARVFLRSPKLYILDESADNLDAATAEKVIRSIEAHAKNVGAGIIYISHNENIIRRCDNIIDLNHYVTRKAA